MLRILMIICSVGPISACNESTGNEVTTRSATTKSLLVSYEEKRLRIVYDPAVAEGVATLNYADPVPSLFELLEINAHVIPMVERATNCRVIATPVSDNRLLPNEATTTVPIACPQLVPA